MFDELNAIARKTPIDEEELHGFSPLIANRFIHFTGFNAQADTLNKFSFSIDAYCWFLLAQKIMPKQNVFWKYMKKPKKEETSFFEEDVAKFFKVNKRRAKEYISLLKESDKIILARKFGYDKAQQKKIGLKVKKEKPAQQVLLNSWW